MIELFRAWIDRYPISVDRGRLAENDWEGFKAQTAAMGDRLQIVGDDLLVWRPRNNWTTHFFALLRGGSVQPG